MSAPHDLNKPAHECGVFAIYGHPDAAILTYYGLFALQHRGQESAGIVTATGSGQPFASHKAMGLVSQVFTMPDLEELRGTRAIGHVRYSTTGSSNLKNAQPFVVDTARGQIAIAHNGNLVNAAQLRLELEAEGSIFQTTVDSEIALHLLAKAQGDNPIAALRRMEGAFSMVILGENELIGVRDPFGFARSRSASSTAPTCSRPRPAPSTSSTPSSSARSSPAKSSSSTRTASAPNGRSARRRNRSAFSNTFISRAPTATSTT